MSDPRRPSDAWRAPTCWDSVNTFLPPSIVQMRMSQPPGVYIHSHISSMPDHLVLRYRLADLHGVPAWQLHIPIAVNIRSGSLWTAVVYNTNVYLEPTVTRTQIYVTDEQSDSLANQSARTGRPMSELIREALDQYLRGYRQERRQEVLRSVAGLWADRTDLTQSDDARATLDRDLSP